MQFAPKHKRREWKTQWHEWFAWFPVKFEDGTVAWLETVERRKMLHDFQHSSFHWQYRYVMKFRGAKRGPVKPTPPEHAPHHYWERRTKFWTEREYEPAAPIPPTAQKR